MNKRQIVNALVGEAVGDNSIFQLTGSDGGPIRIVLSGEVTRGPQVPTTLYPSGDMFVAILASMLGHGDVRKLANAMLKAKSMAKSDPRLKIVADAKAVIKDEFQTTKASPIEVAGVTIESNM